METNKSTIETLNSTLHSVEDLLSSIHNNVDVETEKEEEDTRDDNENLRQLLQNYVRQNILIPSQDLETKKINHLFRKWAGKFNRITLHMGLEFHFKLADFK